ADRRQKLLQELASVDESQRGASFVCAMALCSPDGSVLHTTEGRWRGRIGFEERGENGFGYDAIFYLRNRDKTVAELESHEKHELSHRGQAWRQMLEFLTNNYFEP
ncbi:MAG TPA: non-canonical purine NTP pyrophosphatase, partial [Candidatus Obscuribacterales bacterium]